MVRSAVALAGGVVLWALAAPGTVAAQAGEGARGLGTPQPTELPPPPPPPDGGATTAPSGAEGFPEPPAGRYPEAPRSAELGAEAGPHIPSRIATRIRVLDEDLSELAARGGHGVVDGVLSVLAGGLSITFGVLANNGTSSDREFARYLFLWGGGQIARGVIDFAIPLHADDAAIEMQHMPMGSPEEVRLRLHYGEQALEGIARRARIGRLLDASIGVGVGLAAIPLYMTHGHFEVSGANDWFVLFASGISVITGVINLVMRTDAEKRWNAYEALRDRLANEEGDDRPSETGGAEWQVGFAPMRGGAGGMLQARF